MSWHGNSVIACGLGVGYKGCSIGGFMTDKNFNVNGSILWKRDYKLFSIAKQLVTVSDLVSNKTAYTMILFNKYIITVTRKPVF